MSSKIKILIVEDTTLLWSSMKRALKLFLGRSKDSATQISIQCVSDYDSAVASLSIDPPDLIICDYTLPNLRNGLELFQLTLLKRPRIPFLLISAMGTDGYLKLVDRMENVPRFLSKPFSLNEFEDVVLSLIETCPQVESRAA